MEAEIQIKADEYGNMFLVLDLKRASGMKFEIPILASTYLKLMKEGVPET